MRTIFNTHHEIALQLTDKVRTVRRFVLRRRLDRILQQSVALSEDIDGFEQALKHLAIQAAHRRCQLRLQAGDLVRQLNEV